MKVRNFMTADPVVISHNDPIREAKRLLDEHQFRHLPIVNDGRVIGILSDRDINRSLAVAEAVSSVCGVETDAELRIKDIMTENPMCLHPDDPLKHAAKIMLDKKIGCLPVVDNGSLVGIITGTDILKVFVEMTEYIGK